MSVQATTGETGNRLFGGMDLVSLHSDGLGSGIDISYIFSELSVWHSATLRDLILGVKTLSGTRSYLYEQVAMHILNDGYQYFHPCQYGKIGAIRCVRFLDHSGAISEVRFRNNKIYER